MPTPTFEPVVEQQDKFYFIGADIAESVDWTAVVVIESEWVDSGKLDAWGNKKYWDRLDVIDIDRYKGVILPDIAEYLRQRKADPRLFTYQFWRETSRWTYDYPQVVIDRTGMGTGVSHDLIKAGVSHLGVSITGGEKVNRLPRGGYGVPKKMLIHGLRMALESGRLQVSDALEHGKTLREEILNFKMRQNINTGYVGFEPWREGEHDDLVFGAALAVWGADNRRKRLVYAA